MESKLLSKDFSCFFKQNVIICHIIMEITINGKKQGLDCPRTLQVFIEQTRLNPNRIIAEVNEKIIKREKWGNYTLKNGDQIELITFVGGG